MIELVYMSQAKRIFDEDDLEALLAVARRNNAERGITGLLLYDGVGTFLQALEGEKEDVDALFNTISQDERHTSIQRLSKTDIKHRCFPDWKMGFQRISSEDLNQNEGYSDFLEQYGHLEAQKTEEHELLFEVINRFKQNTKNLHASKN